MAHTLALGLPVAILLATASAAGAQAPAEDPSQFPALTASARLKRDRWLLERRTYPLAEIPAGAKLRALRDIQAFKAATLAPAQTVSGQVWVNIGPAPILGGQIGTTSPTRPMSGRVADIAVDPQDGKHWFIGAAQGGVWETRDAGTTWAPKTDTEASLAMGAIAFAPSDPNIIYAGTGEGVAGGGSYAGLGLLKSTDGGVRWQLLAGSRFAKTSFVDIAVDPTNPNVVVAATAYGRTGRGREYPPSIPGRGIFRSIDGGATWSRRLNAVAASDLEVDPTGFTRQYAGIGDPFGTTDNGVYRSLDAGLTWARVSGPWDQLQTSAGIGRVELALAPSNPNVLYVSIQDAADDVGRDEELLGLWRTGNAWDPTPTWTRISVAATDDGTGLHGYCGWYPPRESVSAQCDYDHEIIVDPTDADILYAGGIALWKFNRRTDSWTEVSKLVSDPANGIHVDQHAMAWAGSRLIVGNDGGVWSSTDGGGSWLDHNTNLSITQFYAGGLHPSSPNFALGGSQDNGTKNWTGGRAWQFVFGGDGGPAAISAVNPDERWAVSAQELDIRRTLDGGSTFRTATSGIDTPNALFIAPFARCPTNSDVFIAGTNNLWRSNDFFSAATPSWSANGPEIGRGISAVAFAASDSTCNTYAFGTASGKVLRTASGGGSGWTDIGGTLIPGRYVTALAFDPGNANVLYVALSGFDEGTPGLPGHVFKTANALAAVPTWSNVSPPVNIPHNAIALDPFDVRIVYVGTDLGAWKSTDGGSSWTHMGPETGMPNVAIFDLQINHATDRLVAFTYGRGAFALAKLEGSCRSPTVIPGAGGTFAGTTRGPNRLEGCADLKSGSSGEQVFQWTPAASGVATIGTCGRGTDYDSVLYLRSTSCTSGPLLGGGCNDDAPGCANATGTDRASRITPRVTAGETYFIVVDGHNGEEGNFGLTITPPTTTTTTTVVTTTTRTTATTTSTTRPAGTSTTVSSTTSSTSTTTTTSLPPGSYDLTWSTIDGGGGLSTATNFSLVGTIAQPDAGYLAGGSYTLMGGFWASTQAFPACLLDVDGSGRIDVATDVVYVARHRLGLTPVPPSFRTIDPTIPSDSLIAARIDAAGAALDVDGSGRIDVATDVVYVARHRLGLTPVPPSFRAIDPTIPADAVIAAAIVALCP